MTIRMEDVVARYMKLREKKDLIEAQAKQKTSELRKQMDLLEAYILSKMETDGVTTYKTAFGTAFRSEHDYATVADWDALLEYVKNNEAWELLERRVNKMSVKGYLNEKLPIPPGVNYGKKFEVSFRKPANKD